MSLTAFLKHPLGKEFRERMLLEFPTPKINLGAIKAEPLTKDHPIAGAAFDYLLRFVIERNTDSKKIEKLPLIGEQVYKSLLNKIANGPLQFLSSGGVRVYTRKELKIILNKEFSISQKSITEFKKTGKVNVAFIKACIFLAKLDMYARSRQLHSQLEKQEKEIANDVMQIYKLVDLNLFSAKKKCFLNPSFGHGSLIGVSDSDLLIDDVLIDIKATKNDKLQRNDFNQILGYYILSLISGVNNNSKVNPIKKIGIYYARFGFLWTIQIEDLGDEKKFAEIKGWFMNYPPLKHQNNINAPVTKNEEKTVKEFFEETKLLIRNKCIDSKYPHLVELISRPTGLDGITKRCIKTMANEKRKLSTCLADIELELEGRS